jgi:hypothetical protein
MRRCQERHPSCGSRAVHRMWLSQAIPSQSAMLLLACTIPYHKVLPRMSPSKISNQWQINKYVMDHTINNACVACEQSLVSLDMCCSETQVCMETSVGLHQLGWLTWHRSLCKVCRPPRWPWKHSRVSPSPAHR